MAYDYDVDEAQAQLHHQQLINDERKNIDLRRSRTRQHLLNQVVENGSLMQQKAALEKANNELLQKITVLEGQIEGLTELAKTKLYQGAAVRTTLRHVRDIWAADAPNSAKRLELESGIEEFFKATLTEHKGAVDIIKQVHGYINEALAHKKTQRTR